MASVSAEGSMPRWVDRNVFNLLYARIASVRLPVRCRQSMRRWYSLSASSYAYIHLKIT